MESKKTLKIVLFLLLGIIIIVSLYLLNDKYEWIKFNNDNTTTNNNKEEEKIDDLTFNNKAYLEKIIESSNIDVNANLNEEQTTTKKNVLNQFTTLNNTLKENIDNKKKELLNKEVITTDDIDDFRKFLLTEASDYNNAIAELSGDVDYNLYTIIIYNMPLLEYYYIDSIEGTYLIDVNYAYVYNVFKDKLNNSAKDYSILKNNVYKYANSNHLYKDGALVVSWEEFEKIILLYDDYMKKYTTDNVVKKEYDNLFDIYTGKLELPNTPIYEEDGVTIKEEILKTYKDIINNHSNFSRYNEIKNKYEGNNTVE